MNWLDIRGRRGTELNRDNFTFVQNIVEFTGFSITNESVKSAAKYLTAIRDFPIPVKLNNVRAWLGLVNQVACVFTRS